MASVLGKNIWEFDPRSLGGCIGWYDASDSSTLYSDTGGTVNASLNGTVAYWRDKSNNFNHGTQTTAGSRPTYQSDGIYFSGSTWLNLTVAKLPVGSDPCTVFCVASTVNNNNTVFSYGSGTAARQTVIFGSSKSVLSVAGFTTQGGASYTQSSIVVSSTTPCISCSIFYDNWGLYTTGNGALATSYTQLSYGTVNATNAYIGRPTLVWGGFFGWLTGTVREIVIFDRALDNTERQQMEGYLSAKYRITLGNTLHPYYTTDFNSLVPPRGRSFQPTDIDGCQLWVDPTDSNNLGGQLVLWNDKSGSNNHAAIASTLCPYVDKVNNAVTFTGSQMLTSALSASTNYETAFIVMRVPYGANSNTILSANASATGGRQYRIDVSSSGVVSLVTATANVSDVLTNTTTLVPGQLCVLDFLSNGTSLGHYVNGTVQSNLLNPLPTYTANLCTLIGRHSASQSLNGHIYEIVVYQGANPSATQARQQVEGYLAWKWGIQGLLPSSHPFYSTAATLDPLNVTSIGSKCMLWLDASDRATTLSGYCISQWNDKSNNNRHATGSANTQPAYVNGRGVLFNKATFSNYLSMNVPYSANHSIFMVAGCTTSQSMYWFGRASAGGSGPALVQNYSGQSLEYFDLTDRATLSSAPAGTFLANYTRQVGGQIVGYYMGSQAFSIAQSVNSNTTTAWSTLGNSYLGTNQDYAHGLLREFIIVNSVVSSTDRQTIEGYLAWRWGLQSSLPTGHLYKNSAPVAFSPSSISNCAVWFDGADTSQAVPVFTNDASDRVHMVVDRSGTDNHLYSSGLYRENAKFFNAGSVGSRNAFTLYALNYGQLITNGSIALNPTSHSYFYVINYPSNSTAPVRFLYYGGRTDGNYLGQNVSGTTQYLEYNNLAGGGSNAQGTVGTYASSFAHLAGNTFLCSAVRDGRTVRLSVNGNILAVVNANETGVPATGTLSLFGATSAAQYVVIGDVLVFNAALAKNQQEQVEGYIMWKYGIHRGLTMLPFPPTHSFFYFPPPSLTPTLATHSYFRPTIDPSDFSPIIWLDCNDSTSYTLDASNRIQTLTNKGTQAKVGMTVSFSTTSAISFQNLNYTFRGQPFFVASSSITNLTTGTTYFMGANVSGNVYFVANSFANAIAGTYVSNLGRTGAGTILVSPNFRRPVSLNGPLLTQSGVGSGNGLNYMDFSSGGTHTIKSITVTDSFNITVEFGSFSMTHLMTAGRQVRLYISSGLYSDGTSATGLSGTYIIGSVRAATSTVLPALVLPIATGKTVNSVLTSLAGFIEFGNIQLNTITMTNGSSGATFATSSPHGLTNGDSIFLSLPSTTIDKFPSSLNQVNGVYAVASVPTSSTFTVTSLLNSAGSAVAATGDINGTTITSNASPAYAYFPYNGYALELVWPNLSTIHIFAVIHMNPGPGSQISSAGARSGRTNASHPPFFATAATANTASGSWAGTSNTPFGAFSTDVNYHVANYNGGIRMGHKRNNRNAGSFSSTAADEFTSPSSPFRVVYGFIRQGNNSFGTEVSSYSTGISINGGRFWSANGGTPFNSNRSVTATVYARVISVSCTTTSPFTVTYNFVPYGYEATEIPFPVGSTIFVSGLTGTSGYVYTSTAQTVTAATPTSASIVIASAATPSQIQGGLTGLIYTTQAGGAGSGAHIRVGADTDATNAYSSLSGFLTEKFFDGGIAELLVIPNGTTFTTETRYQIEGYLAQKYRCQSYLSYSTPNNSNNTRYSITAASYNNNNVATLTFTNSNSYNPFIVGTTLTVVGMTPTGYASTYVVTALPAVNQVSYSVSGVNMTGTISLTGAYVTATTANDNTYVSPYVNSVRMASKNAPDTGMYAGLAYWIDASNRSKITTVSGALTDGSQVASVSPVGGSITQAAAYDSTYNTSPIFVENSQNRLPGLSFWPTLATVTLTATAATTNIATITSAVEPALYQRLVFGSTFGGFPTTSFIRSVTALGNNTYNITVTSGTDYTVSTIATLTTATGSVTGSLIKNTSLSSTFGSNIVVYFNNLPSNPEFTIFAVFRGSGMISHLAGSNDRNVLNTNSIQQIIANTGSQTLTVVPTPLSTTTYINVYTRRANRFIVRTTGNGTQNINSSTQSSFLGFGTASMTIVLGASTNTRPGNSTSNLTGMLYELIHYKYALTDQFIERMEGYLAWKWGLQASLPPTHPYYYASP